MHAYYFSILLRFRVLRMKVGFFYLERISFLGKLFRFFGNTKLFNEFNEIAFDSLAKLFFLYKYN